MADARVPTLKAQASDAARTHLELPRGLATDALAAASSRSRRRSMRRRRATLRPAISTRRPAGLRPAAIWRPRRAGVLGNNTTRYVFPLGDAWPSCRTAAATRRRDARKRGARVDRARPRRVHVPHVLDQRLDALEHVGPRQSREAHLLDVPWHAHDGHGHRERLDGHRHDESAVGARSAAEPVDDATRRSCRCSRSRATPTSRRIRFSAA